MSAIYNQPAAAGKVGGSGTLNYIPKWTPDGGTLGNSLMYDNGTNIGIGTITPGYAFQVVTVPGVGFCHTAGTTNFTSYIDNVSLMTGWGSTNSTYGVRLFVQDGVHNLLMGANGNVMIGYANSYTILAERFSVKGSGATSATFLAKFVNSATAEALFIRDDLQITMGANFTWTPTTSTLAITGSVTILGGTSSQAINFVDGTTAIYKTGTILTFITPSFRIIANTAFTSSEIQSAGSIIFTGGGVIGFTVSPANNYIGLTDGHHFTFGTATGSIIATTTLQKFAFHGATPVIQRAGAAQALVVTTAATNVTPFGYTTAAQADAIVTLVNELRTALVEKGLIKGAA